MSTEKSLPPRTALFLPASNPRAVAKAAGLAVDMVILDLEDAVKEADKGAARDAAAAARFDDRLFAMRTNAADTSHFTADLAAVRTSTATHVVIPKVEDAATVERVAQATGLPVLAMIETPAAILDLSAIIRAPGLIALIAGTNDLALGLRLPPGGDRDAMTVALQTIVLAARARGLWALDGVFNALEDAPGLAAECAAGRAMGFDGKTLIHPAQIDAATAAFSPTEAEIADAHALIAAASGGAQRHRGAMVETLHVEAARAVIERARTP